MALILTGLFSTVVMAEDFKSERLSAETKEAIKAELAALPAEERKAAIKKMRKERKQAKRLASDKSGLSAEGTEGTKKRKKKKRSKRGKKQ